MSAIDLIFSVLRLCIQVYILVYAIKTKNKEEPLNMQRASNFLSFFMRNPLASLADVDKEKERKLARRLGTLIALCGIVVLEVFHILGIYYQVFPATMAQGLQIVFWIAAIWALDEVEFW